MAIFRILFIGLFASFLIPTSVLADNSSLDLDLIYITREQYKADHHNTATLFQKGEINEHSFEGGSSLKILNTRTGLSEVLFSSEEGVIRDPELSYDADKILFSHRKNRDDDYHIYELTLADRSIRQLTFASGVSDIDPMYLPDGRIVFTSTREPKYCMCNRHIMANLYRMEANGANIVQIGKSTLFEGHSAMLPDGRILYDRWEYVDRNFGDAQGLWTVNPDGTNHAVYYGNNMKSPGGVIDGRAVPGTGLVICIFSSCHDRPWGAIALVDRSKGVDGKEAVVRTWPPQAYEMIGMGNWDKYKSLDVRYEDPYPLDAESFLCSKSIWLTKKGHNPTEEKMGIYLLRMDGSEVLIHEEEQDCFDPIPLRKREKERLIPDRTNYAMSTGFFYIQDVYEGTHMQGVERGSVKYLRVVESPEKRSWSGADWKGQGAQAPGMNWHSFENKRILGIAPVEEDGSVYVEVPSERHLYFQLLDADKKMIQSMRSGTMVQPGEVRGCIGCHEDRLSVPPPRANLLAMRSRPVQLPAEKEEAIFSYSERVQPIWDKHCIQCHDLGKEGAKHIILSGDSNPYFSASYVDIQVKGLISCIGGGPAEIQEAGSWGSGKSDLVAVLENEHHGVKLSEEEWYTVLSWIDLNGVFYPEYETAYPDNPAGRSPLTRQELEALGKLTAVNFSALNSHQRKLGPQISFERPELSPCLASLAPGSEAHQKALEIITLGKERLLEKPRNGYPGFQPAPPLAKMLEKYDLKAREQDKFREAILTGTQTYDPKK